MRFAIATLAAAGVLFGSIDAGATPSARLVYSRTQGAEACPDEEVLRRSVSTRVGYDPFFAWAQKTIVTSMARSERGFIASVALVDERGIEHGARMLETDGECGELLDVVALAIALAIDPRLLTMQSGAAEPLPAPLSSIGKVSTATPTVAPALAPDRLVITKRSPSSPLVVEGAAGAVVTVGTAPLPVAGLVLGGGVRWDRFSVEVEGRVDAPESTPATGGGSVSTMLVIAALLSCTHVWPFQFCILGQLGSMQAWSEGVSNPRSESDAWAAAGGRFGVLMALREGTLLRVRSDVVGNLSRATLRLNGTDQWTAQPMAASLGVDLMMCFQ